LRIHLFLFILFLLVGVLQRRLSVVQGSAVQHDVRLWSMNRVVHPPARLLHAQSSPFRLYTSKKER